MIQSPANIPQNRALHETLQEEEIPSMPQASTRRPLASAFVAVALWACLSDLGHADVIHLKDGTTVEGEIVSQTSSQLTVKTRFGTVPIKRSRVDRIETKATPQQEYQKRRAKLAKDDVGGRYELAMYCKDNKLSKEYRKLLAEILKIMPQHAGANMELGNVEYDGKWFTKDGLKEHLERETARMESEGLVKYNGRWMTQDEVMKARGFIQVDGAWMLKEEYDRLLAARDFEEVFKTPLTISDSKHFSVRNTRTNEDNQYMLDVCEDVLAHFVKLSEPDSVERPFFEKYQFFVYILDEPRHLNQFIESGYIDRYKPPKNSTERYLDSTNFSYYFPIPLIVLSEGRHLQAGGNRETALKGMNLIHLGQVLLRRLKRGGRPPSWAEAGVAHYVEGLFNEECTVSIVEYDFYEPYVDKWIEGWETFKKWRKKLADPSQRSRMLSIRKLNDTPIEELRIDNLAKSWSLVHFMLEHHRKEFFEFVRLSDLRIEGEKRTPARAFEMAFAQTPEEMDDAWDKWISTDPIRRPIH